jgi:hypothetical protein
MVAANADRIPQLRRQLGAVHPHALVSNAVLARWHEHLACELQMLEAGTGIKTAPVPPPWATDGPEAA